MSDLSDEEEEENPPTCQVEISEGTKDDFISMMDETVETVSWVRKFRDYDCYKKMNGDDFKLHHRVARTKRNKYVGSCICVEAKKFAFISIYFVCQEFRRRGIGKRLLEATLDSNLRHKNIGIFSTESASPYFGNILTFRKTADWKIDVVRLKNVDLSKIKGSDNQMDVKSVRDIMFDQLLEYDRKVSGDVRSSFLKHWAYDRFDCVCKVALDSSGNIVGYGCGRLLSIVGYPALSPIYCDNDDVFLMIIKEILLCFPEEMEEKKQIGLWTPSVNTPKLRNIVRTICDLEVAEQYIPQFTYGIPDVDIQRAYGISEPMMFI